MGESKNLSEKEIIDKYLPAGFFTINLFRF